MNARTSLILLSCLVPLAALAATVFFNAPVLPTVLIALVALAPIGYRLLSPPPESGRHGGGPDIRPR